MSKNSTQASPGPSCNLSAGTTLRSYRVTIPYKPMPKASVRISARGGFFMPSSKDMGKIKSWAAKWMQGKEMLKGPLLAIMHFRIPAAKTWKQDCKREPFHLMPHAQRPDGDNIEKYLNDCLSGYVWQDDSQLSWVIRSKTFTKSFSGCMHLFVTEIPREKPDYDKLLGIIRENIRIMEEEESA